MPKRPRTWLSTLITIFTIVLLLVVYAYGWRVTKIDLVSLITDARDVAPIINALLQPRLLEQELTSQAARVNFWVPCPRPAPTPAPLAESVPHLVISATCGEIGDVVTVEGYNFRPSSEGILRWVVINSRSFLTRLDTNENGYFTHTFAVPEVRLGDEPLRCGVEFEVSWREGPLKATTPLKLTLEKMVETIFLALMATTLGIIVAIPVSFFGARNLMGKSSVGIGVYYLTRTFFNLLRSIEPLIMAIVFAVWVGIGPFAGVLALTVHSIASLGKLYSESIESIDEGPIEAITATGANRLQTIFFAVVPQIVPQYLAFTIYRWDINVRMSTIIGFVGGGGIGFLLQQWINLMQYRNAAVAVWAIAIVVATLDYVSAKVREKVV